MNFHALLINGFCFQCITRFGGPIKNLNFPLGKPYFLRSHASNQSSSVSNNLHFHAGKSIFFVSNTLAHFRLSLLVPSKTFILLQEHQYFAFLYFQQTILCFQKWVFPCRQSQYLSFTCISALSLVPTRAVKNLHFHMGKSIFCVPRLPTDHLLFPKKIISCRKTNMFVSNALAHFRLSPRVPSKPH